VSTADSHEHEDDHAHSDADHAHGVTADTNRRRLTIALALIVAFMCGEVIAGILANSLALLSDAGHMLTDAAAIGLSLLALRLAARPAGGNMTYGLKRAEILSAQANGATLLILAMTFTSGRSAQTSPRFLHMCSSILATTRCSMSGSGSTTPHFRWITSAQQRSWFRPRRYGATTPNGGRRVDERRLR
jgi:hypothetical protein